MENKYYTPSIEEFFVGFEYEEEDSLEDNLWIKRTLDFNYGWLEIPQDFANDKRVKYLDSSDIEELGFIFEEQVAGKITFKYTKNNFIELHKLYTTILILNNGRTIFEGFIKNKSELIRLLGWLNV